METLDILVDVWEGSYSVQHLFYHSHYQGAKTVQHYAISGVYTGIFAMYLQYYASRKDVSKGNSIIFYALSRLYLLSLSTIALDVFDLIGTFIPVSKDKHLV